MINISNHTSKDNPPWPEVQPGLPATATGAPTPATADSRTRGGGNGRRGGLAGRILITAATAGRVLLDWLAVGPRRLGDRLFVPNDTEACWQNWQVTRIHGGLGRRYRDPRFDTLAECPQCRGTGRATGGTTSGGTGRATGGTTRGATGHVTGGTPGRACAPCLGTGRITLGEVS